MLVVGLARPRLFVHDHDGRAFGFVVETALPVLLGTALSIAEVAEVVVHQQMLAGALRRLVVDSSGGVVDLGGGFN